MGSLRCGAGSLELTQLVGRKKSYYILGIGDSGHVRRHMGSFDWREGINE